MRNTERVYRRYQLTCVPERDARRKRDGIECREGERGRDGDAPHGCLVVGSVNTVAFEQRCISMRHRIYKTNHLGAHLKYRHLRRGAWRTPSHNVANLGSGKISQ